MGMTIDEAIYCMKSYIPNEEYTHCTECKYYGARNNNTCASSEGHQVAIEIMRKYQKIEQILDDWKSDGGAFEMSESYWLNQIKEVVEDECDYVTDNCIDMCGVDAIIQQKINLLKADCEEWAGCTCVYYQDEAEVTLSDNDKEMDKRAEAAVRAAIEKAKICNKPIGRYDTDKRQAYIEYPNGERKYISGKDKE